MEQQNTSLIPLYEKQVGDGAIQTVDARELHEFLGIKTHVTTWIQRRIEEYGFIEGIDFIRVSTLKTGNPTAQIDYFLSLGMAKELSMVEKTKKSQQARRYFIECERRLKEGEAVQSLSPARLLLQSVEQLVAHEEAINKLKAANDAHETRLEALESDQPPAGKQTIHDWLYINQKAWAGKDLRKQLNARCRRLETPVPYTPKGVLHAWWYYSPETIEAAWAYVTRQMSFLRDPGVIYQAKKKRKRG